jgi:acyl-coenzyme A synthetase/AMP-(fatty) acid ligase
MGSPPAFRIDFDPRWSLKLTDRSTAKFRYLEHLVDQALRLIEKESVRILFGSPPVLQRLAERTDERVRNEIQAVHYGGTALSPDLYMRFRKEWFPSAIHLSGYGNSLVGVAFESDIRESHRLAYFPSSDRHRIRLIPLGDESIADRLSRDVDEGETGQVVISRLDPTFFIPNLVERDQAERIFSPESTANLGWLPWGIRHPRPVLEKTLYKGTLY